MRLNCLEAWRALFFSEIHHNLTLIFGKVLSYERKTAAPRKSTYVTCHLPKESVKVE